MLNRPDVDGLIIGKVWRELDIHAASGAGIVDEDPCISAVARFVDTSMQGRGKNYAVVRVIGGYGYDSEAAGVVWNSERGPICGAIGGLVDGSGLGAGESGLVVRKIRGEGDGSHL